MHTMEDVHGHVCTRRSQGRPSGCGSITLCHLTSRQSLSLNQAGGQQAPVFHLSLPANSVGVAGMHKATSVFPACARAVQEAFLPTH